jgi:hypothetical protein
VVSLVEEQAEGIICPLSYKATTTREKGWVKDLWRV